MTRTGGSNRVAYFCCNSQEEVCVLNLTTELEREKTPGTSAELLQDVLMAQENLIYAQQEVMMRLLHENVEQENFINEMMRGETV